jgi:hypothetical protein
MLVHQTTRSDVEATGRLHRVTLWTLRKQCRRLTAELVRVDNHWEVRFFAQGILFLWHTCLTGDAALAYATLIQEACLQDHWHDRRRAAINRRMASLTRANTATLT